MIITCHFHSLFIMKILPKQKAIYMKRKHNRERKKNKVRHKKKRKKIKCCFVFMKNSTIVMLTESGKHGRDIEDRNSTLKIISAKIIVLNSVVSFLAPSKCWNSISVYIKII